MGLGSNGALTSPFTAQMQELPLPQDCSWTRSPSSLEVVSHLLASLLLYGNTNVLPAVILAHTLTP